MYVYCNYMYAYFKAIFWVFDKNFYLGMWGFYFLLSGVNLYKSCISVFIMLYILENVDI